MGQDTRSLPKISVITPSFNQGAYIGETIESVLAQNYPNFEHIIVDGGSTDNTIEVLKKYKHLNWISEKDKGQSDALNKGFLKATGDIVAWINSDDWYAPNIFHDVAAALETYPVVMGDCEVIGEKGVILDRVQNIERGWFDLIKYWIPYSIPAQPAVFFRRELLEKARWDENTYVDRNLFFCMDFDLWAKLAILMPFTQRIPKVVAYYRMTDSNKTGEASGGLSPAEPEMSLVFRRSETFAFAPSIPLSFIITANTANEDLQRTLETLLLQQIAAHEIIVTPYGCDAATLKAIKKTCAALNERQRITRKNTYIRLIPSEATSHFGAAQSGIAVTEGRAIMVAPAGSLFSSEFNSQALALLNDDRIGLALPLTLAHSVAKHFKREVSDPTWMGGFDCKPALHMSAPALPEAFLARRSALLEFDELSDGRSAQFELRRMVWQMAFKGWSISTQQKLSVTTPEPSSAAAAEVNAKRDWMNATIISKVAELGDSEPFAQVRKYHGCSVTFDKALVEQANALLKN